MNLLGYNKKLKGVLFVSFKAVHQHPNHRTYYAYYPPKNFTLHYFNIRMRPPRNWQITKSNVKYKRPLVDLDTAHFSGHQP